MATESKTLFDLAMELQVSDTPSVRQAVPFFNVKNIEASLRFYVDGLGFTITQQWERDGRIHWCRLELGPVRRHASGILEGWATGRVACRPAGPGSVHLLHVRGRDRRIPRFKSTRAQAGTAVCR